MARRGGPRPNHRPMTIHPDSTRIDKWLWAVRLCKTRGLAAEMCAAGKVKRLGKPLRASAGPHPGDVLEIPFPEGPGCRVITVLAVIAKRVSAPAAAACYSESTPHETIEAQQRWHAARLEHPGGRPTKKNRRNLDKIHGFLD
jgi:ribosome-associated heat shock protein Hsp15